MRGKSAVEPHSLDQSFMFNCCLFLIVIVVATRMCNIDLPCMSVYSVIDAVYFTKAEDSWIESGNITSQTVLWA